MIWLRSDRCCQIIINPTSFKYEKICENTVRSFISKERGFYHFILKFLTKKLVHFPTRPQIWRHWEASRILTTPHFLSCCRRRRSPAFLLIFFKLSTTTSLFKNQEGEAPVFRSENLLVKIITKNCWAYTSSLS